MQKQQKRNYRAWNIDLDSYPKNGSLTQKAHFIAQFGILAPSTHNTQPWNIRVTHNEIVVELTQKRQLPYADPAGEYALMSIGALIENIILAADYYGLNTAVTVRDDGITVIKISQSQTTSYIPIELILNRFSDKRPYLQKKIPYEVLRSIEDRLQEFKQVKRTFVQDQETYRKLLKIHLKASKRSVDNPSFVRELSRWLKPSNTRSYYGMPGFVMGIPKLKSIIGPALFKMKPAAFSAFHEKEAELLQHAAGFFVISSVDNDPKTIIEVGRCYQKASLLLRQHGIASTPLTALVHHEDLNTQASELLHLNGRIRFFMRFGYPIDSQLLHTPRAPL